MIRSVTYNTDDGYFLRFTKADGSKLWYFSKYTNDYIICQFLTKRRPTLENAKLLNTKYKDTEKD